MQIVVLENENSLNVKINQEANMKKSKKTFK